MVLIDQKSIQVEFADGLTPSPVVPQGAYRAATAAGSGLEAGLG